MSTSFDERKSTIFTCGGGVSFTFQAGFGGREVLVISNDKSGWMSTADFFKLVTLTATHTFPNLETDLEAMKSHIERTQYTPSLPIKHLKFEYKNDKIYFTQNHTHILTPPENLLVSFEPCMTELADAYYESER